MVTKKRLMDVAMVAALLLLAVLGYTLSPLLLPVADVTATPESDCDLHAGPCAATLPDGRRISLSVTPRPIPVVKPLELEVSLTGPVASRRVEVDFAGVDMNMGLNRTVLKPAGEGRYAGQATLPVCITGGMAWKATVLVEEGRQKIAASFRFETGSH